jgi:HAD domain in Swiss Army Knife RNA repair proteins
MRQSAHKPLLFVDIDGVLSLFGFAPAAVPENCSWHQVDGIVHLLSHDAARNLLALGDVYELVWCSGWKDRANDHLPHVLGLGPYPHLTFGEDSPDHWKLQSITAHAGDRPLAWIDDDLNEAVHAWAAARSAPTLIVETDPATGLTPALAERLRSWAQTLDPAAN